MDVKLVVPQFVFVNPDGSPVQIRQAGATYAAGNNQQVVAAVAGQVIRVLTIGMMNTYAGANNFTLRSGSGGTIIFGPYGLAAVNTTDFIAAQEVGICDTAAGVGLYVDIAQSYMLMSFRYITFTPALGV